MVAMKGRYCDTRTALNALNLIFSFKSTFDQASGKLDFDFSDTDDEVTSFFSSSILSSTVYEIEHS